MEQNEIPKEQRKSFKEWMKFPKKQLSWKIKKVPKGKNNFFVEQWIIPKEGPTFSKGKCNFF
jgi:hypothetical protein